MKNIFLSFFLLLFINSIHGQKTEFGIALNSGLFSFKGLSTTDVSAINYSDRTNSGYTNNPYGSKMGLCHGISANIKRVNKKNFIVGFDLGYETLRSKVNIDRVYSNSSIPAIGETFLNLKTINSYPFLGKRFNAKSFSFDVMAGLDFAYILSANEKGSAITNNDVVYETSRDRTNINLDIKPRIQFGLNYRKTAIYVGYSYGLANYHSGYDGALVNDSHSEMIRFGLMYRIK
jgi:hypothetical protein